MRTYFRAQHAGYSFEDMTSFVSADGGDDLENIGGLCACSTVADLLPGAFTPTCSTYQLPDFEKMYPEFKAEGIDAAVLNLYSVKPLDEEAVLTQAKKTGAIVTVEDHTIYGGLGGAVAETLAQHLPTPMEFVGTKDTFGESGTQDELFRKYGLTAADIAAAARRTLTRKAARG